MKNSLCLFGFALILFSCSPRIDEKVLATLNQHSATLTLDLTSEELKSVNKELVKDPNNADLYYNRSKVYLGLKLNAEALRDAELAIKIDSLIPAYHLMKVDAHFAMNNTRAAKEDLLIIEKKFP